MINIGIYHMFTSAVSHYRITTPLSYLRRKYRNIHLEFIIPGFTDVAVVENCDILLISRPTTDGEYNLILKAKIAGCKVIIDVDDLITDISIFNPAYGSYQQSQIDNFYKCLNEADVVITSTQFLADRLEDYSPVIIPNGVVCEYKFTDKKEDFIVSWRGSVSHRRDLDQYRDVFKELSKRFKLHFFGWLPDFAGDLSVLYTGYTDLASFYHIYYNSDIDFSIFPLEDIPFNHAKSNIAFLAATKAGAAFFTNLKSIEFQQPGVNFDAPTLLDLTDAQLRELKYSMHQQSMTTITNNFNIDTINELRLKIINDLCKL